MTSKTIIRQFQTHDAEALIVLWQTVLPSSQPWNDPGDVLVRKLNRYDGLVFIAELNNAVVGVVMVGYDGVRGWIYGLAVSAEHRKSGIGCRLLKAAESALQSRGCPKVNLQVRSTSSEVLTFYERCGYQTEDRVSLGKPLCKSSCADVPTIQVTDEINLSSISDSDKPAYLKYLNETDEFESSMMSVPFPYSAHDADQWIAKVCSSSEEQDRRRSWAVRRGAQLIGGISLFEMTIGQKAEIGYWLAKPYWGKGIMTDVVLCLCSYAFDEYKLFRIEGRVLATNPRSASVLRKAGFDLEGTLRSCFIRDGQQVDDLIFGLVRDV
ncbi:MAG: GNAT family acetyltransferase [Fuerstiella sp.]|nr:GNAT family acetyltransferase [Fuerstiella sp.]